MDQKCRCRWCNTRNPVYVEYHDHEWGRLRTDDAYLLEMLILESFQAGLSWECILNKRCHFRRAYDNFDLKRIVSYGEEKINELLHDPNIVRSRRKIEASIRNSRIFLSITEEYGSFFEYLKTFTHGEIRYETDRVTSDLSDAVSADLKNRGMTFVGSVTVYSFLQAIGVVYAHDASCYLHKNG